MADRQPQPEPVPPALLPDDLLEHIIGGAGPVSPMLVSALFRRAGIPTDEPGRA